MSSNLICSNSFPMICLTPPRHRSTLIASAIPESPQEQSVMTVSLDNSKAVYQGIKDAGIRFITALPETWLVYLLQMAEDDPEMCLIEVAKEEEAIGIAAGA